MKQRRNNEYSDDDLKSYMAMPVRQKLALLEKMNHFFDRFMPARNKKIWKELQKRGF